MEWNLLTAQNLTIIEREISKKGFSPAEYEIMRRIIYATGDLDYSSVMAFAHNPLSCGRAALEARASIMVDIPLLQAGVANLVQQTFLNPVYCLEEISISTSFLENKTKIWQNLASRYPSAFYIIGENPLILVALLDLIESSVIQPSLIIYTASGFTRKEMINLRLKNSNVPHIRIDSSKGGIGLAMTIFEGLMELAWLSVNLTG